MSAPSSSDYALERTLTSVSFYPTETYYYELQGDVRPADDSHQHGAASLVSRSLAGSTQ
ncbi:MAG: hypothetical protein SOU49_12300 [Sodaliphilus pleomorphus]|uniref:hypothetical protein n=1 Tax=Sodaliphilus pleomorphus TaxID=2606626 RepID=UPI0023F3C91D|nr:hypothetical protein [Sodaliphilus pleomorphus]MDD7065217.1 hypothetical protein [Sodaliphilus pleomorphus]MDY2833502.1 hypothetical protein [Sodaliphilus pleomorphus]